MKCYQEITFMMLWLEKIDIKLNHMKFKLHFF